MTTLTKATTYVLSALMTLIREGRIQRQYMQSRAERYMEFSKGLIIPSNLWDFVHIVDADHPDAVKVLGEEYCKGRSRVAYTKEAYELKGQLTDPSLWFGTVPTIGRNAEGKDGINAGCHRTASIYLLLSDLQASGLDLGFNLDKVKVPVTLNEGKAADHGKQENYGRENDSLREVFDFLMNEWSNGASGRKENRAHWVGMDLPAKPVQYGHLISILRHPESHKLPTKVKVLVDGKMVELKRADHVENPASDLIAEVTKASTLVDISKILEKAFQATLENARVKADDVDPEVKKAVPFRLTYTRVKEVYDAIIADVYKANLNPKVEAQEASKRQHFIEVWQRLSAEGWETSTGGNGGTKPSKNEAAAKSIRAMFNEGSEEEQAAAEKLAEMFESGEINGSVKDFVNAMVKTVAPADFYKEIDLVLPVKGAKKVTQAEANAEARKAVQAAFIQ